MANRDEKAGDGSVWSGLARMEAELQDPEEDETNVYRSAKMAEMRKMATAGDRFAAAVPSGIEQGDEEQPTSRKQLKADRGEGTHGDEDLPDLNPFESTQDDDDTTIGFAELIRLRREQEARPHREPRAPSDSESPDSDRTVALWAEQDAPVHARRRDVMRDVLWVLVLILTTVAVAIAIVQGPLS